MYFMSSVYHFLTIIVLDPFSGFNTASQARAKFRCFLGRKPTVDVVPRNGPDFIEADPATLFMLGTDDGIRSTNNMTEIEDRVFRRILYAPPRRMDRGDDIDLESGFFYHFSSQPILGLIVGFEPPAGKHPHLLREFIVERQSED